MRKIATKIVLLSLFLLGGRLCAHEQLLLVVAEDMNRSDAVLQRYTFGGTRWKKVGAAVRVNVGRNGMGWGIGIETLPQRETDPRKQEGDGKAPAGIFEIGPVFGYAATASTAMPYLQATPDLICIDDSRSPAYNRIVRIVPQLEFRSFEWMRRDDDLYRLGIVVGHNRDAIAGSGSCIFLHIERAPGAGTAGCTSMAARDLGTIVRWLDPTKAPLLVQVPAGALPSLRQRFPGIGE